MFTNWNVFEKSWLFIFTVLGILVAVSQENNWFSFIVLLSGIFCVVLAAKGNILNYYFGIFNSCSYAYLCFNNGLYGELALNLFFYLPTGLSGILLWKKHTQKQQLTHVNQLSKRHLFYIIVASMASIACLGSVLTLIPSQNTPFLDATTNIIAISATLLMIFRFKEQWWFYIALNLFTIFMWAIRLQNGSEEGLMMVLMWFAFLINSFYGFYNWRKLELNSQNTHMKPHFE